MKKSIAIVAMCATALSPVLSTAALADTIPTPVSTGPSTDTLTEMQDQCTDLAAGYDNGNGDRWTGVVIPGSSALTAGPTEVEGTRVVDESTIMHAGDYVPAELEIRGDPFRIGGSVNMFGDQWSTAGYWTDSTYNYTADFESTFTYSFACQIGQEVYHPESIEHHPAEGMYVIRDDLIGTPQAGAALQACNAFNDAHEAGEEQGFWGTTPQGNCQFEGTQAYDETIPEYWDPAVTVATVDGTPIDEMQTDSLYAFEDHGGRVDVTGEYHVGQVVVCISPSTGGTKKGVPGTWRPQNGYSGEKCTTEWMSVAPWGAGTENSNGTYISVPDYALYDL